MHYIGSKRKLSGFVHHFMLKQCIRSNTFADVFAGTASVSAYFKAQGYHIIASDVLASPYVQQYVKLLLNDYPSWSILFQTLCNSSHNDPWSQQWRAFLKTQQQNKLINTLPRVQYTMRD